MLRVLFSVLAVVVAVLAVVLELPVLYAAAAVLLLIALVLVVTSMRRQHQEAEQIYTSVPASPEDELKALGIMEIRAKERRPEARPETEPDAQKPPAEAMKKEPSARPMKSYGLPPEGPEAEPVTNDTRPAHRTQAPASTAQPAPDDPLVTTLQAVRMAVGAQTVCLLQQEDFALDYHIVACVDAAGARSAGDVFTAPAPLLTAHMARRDVTVRAVGNDDLNPGCLGYRGDATRVQEVALAPVPRFQDAAFTFLLADATDKDGLQGRRVRTLMVQFADVLGTLLVAPEPKESSAPDGTTQAEGDEGVRPRSEIVAEEIEHARSLDRNLALALVYLNRAEDLAVQGSATVVEAEHLLADRLRRATPNGRVERFGELTYGVFVNSSVTDIETWSARTQQAFDEENGLLGGGVSIGIAMLQPRHRTADAFRNDATEALREAFVSGTCTIVE